MKPTPPQLGAMWRIRMWLALRLAGVAAALMGLATRLISV